MNQPIEPERKPGPELERLRALSQRPRVYLDRNFSHSIYHLRTSVEAMDVALQGVDMDRQLFPDGGLECEIRRRWAAHSVIVTSIFSDIDRRVRAIDLEVRRLLAID